MKHFGEHIKKLREQKKFLQRQVAAIIETDTAFVSKFEKGEKRLNRGQVIKLAAFFDVPEKELIPLWLSDRLKDTLKNDPYSEEALKLAKQQLKKKK